MSTRAVLGACLLLVTAGSPGLAGPTQAPRRLTVIQNELEYEYAERLVFRLRAESAAEVTDVVLRYTVGTDGPRNRRIPEFVPGRQLRATVSEDLHRGAIPAASVITWWWSITLADGSVHDVVADSLRYLDLRFEWRSIDRAALSVWYYDEQESRAAAIAESAAAVLTQLGAQIGGIPDRRIDIVAFASSDDMRLSLASRGEVYESRLLTLGARVAPDILVLLAGRDVRTRDEVLAHELSHIALNLRFEREYIAAPLWLDEGLAMYTEGPLDDDEQRLLEAAIRSDALMSVRSLTTFPGQADLVPLAYAESRDIVAFLLDEHELRMFRQFVDLVGSGELTTDEALQRAYGYDQETLYQAYRSARGLPPATTPVPEPAGPARRAPRGTGGDVCGTSLLVLPALAVWRRRKATARPSIG